VEILFKYIPFVSIAVAPSNVKAPVKFTSPLTSNKYNGAVIPIPKFPLLVITALVVVAIFAVAVV
jgi:hypothetical protein